MHYFGIGAFVESLRLVALTEHRSLVLPQDMAVHSRSALDNRLWSWPCFIIFGQILGERTVDRTIDYQSKVYNFWRELKEKKSRFRFFCEFYFKIYLNILNLEFQYISVL